MQMQKILLALILSLFYLNGEAQVVSGTINDAASMQPLDFVTVLVRGENIASESKIDG